MNAIKFIKLYGLHSARVIVDDAQENTHYCTETGYHSIELDVNYEPCPDCVSIPELKRLVESVESVESVDRIDHFVEASDMGDDTHIENHVSPLCKVGGEVMKSEFENSIKRSSSYEKLVYQHGERLFIFDDGKYKIAAVQLAWEIFKEKQTEVDELTLQVAEMKSRLNDAYTDGQSAMYTARQTEVDELQRRNQMLNDNIKEQGQKLVYQNEVIETQSEKLLSLRDEKAELQVENKILNQAAATHLRNQNQFMDLYNRLVEQLYPYAIDLEEPVDGDVNITSQEFINGYNRARECAHYNLLEMMESNEEYIRAQCGMLGGGGGSDESN